MSPANMPKMNTRDLALWEQIQEKKNMTKPQCREELGISLVVLIQSVLFLNQLKGIEDQ